MLAKTVNFPESRDDKHHNYHIRPAAGEYRSSLRVVTFIRQRKLRPVSTTLNSMARAIAAWAGLARLPFNVAVMRKD
jgi:hypothetical protein